MQQPTLRTLTFTSSLGQIGPGGIAVVAVVIAASQHKRAGSGLLLAAVAAGAFGFLTLIQAFDFPERYGAS